MTAYRHGFKVATAIPTDELETYLNATQREGWYLVNVIPTTRTSDPHDPRPRVLVIHQRILEEKA